MLLNSKGVTIVVKIISGMRIHEPPYTQAEEDEFYRRVGGGPVTVAHRDRKFTLNPISPVQIPALCNKLCTPTT